MNNQTMDARMKEFDEEIKRDDLIQENYHREDGSHPGEDWEWVTNIQRGQYYSKNFRDGETHLIVDVAFMRSGERLPNPRVWISIWRPKK